jgi:signal transduction histidine kinase
MKLLRILIVDDEIDELGWPKTFSENIRTVPLAELVGEGFEELEIEQVSNQADASKAIDNIGPQGYDLIFLDLRYPLTSDGWAGDEEEMETGFQGMNWLPELRRLQPQAAIVIFTSYATDENLHNAIKAIRDHHANDFIPKTTRFDHIVARIKVAWKNTQDFQDIVLFEEELHNLIRTLAIRAYAEDIGILISRTKTSIFNTAGRIESGDPSELSAAADSIRSQINSLRKEFDELSSLLNEEESRPHEVDVVALIRKILRLYRRVVGNAQAKVKIEPDECMEISTYGGDLKVALYEVITNAIDALKKSVTLPEDRLLEVAVEKTGKNVIVRIADNGDGFSDEALERLFERGYTDKNDGKHQGLGLYIARRMMHYIGGTISAANRTEGGAEVTLSFSDLGQP